MTKANINGTVDIETVPSELTVKFKGNEIVLEYDDACSIIALDDDGFVSSGEGYTAGNHTADLKDLAKGAYEVHMRIQDNK